MKVINYNPVNGFRGFGAGPWMSHVPPARTSAPQSWEASTAADSDDTGNPLAMTTEPIDTDTAIDNSALAAQTAYERALAARGQVTVDNSLIAEGVPADLLQQKTDDAAPIQTMAPAPVSAVGGSMLGLGLLGVAAYFFLK